mmetsp:Transcript_18451/g.29525  ORF Transcript_18451/g.29525 Transcript_18451/m.29525 type:complete len:91 (-) Transcript_18451:957-1229(-)
MPLGPATVDLQPKASEKGLLVAARVAGKTVQLLLVSLCEVRDWHILQLRLWQRSRLPDIQSEQEPRNASGLYLPPLGEKAVWLAPAQGLR